MLSSITIKNYRNIKDFKATFEPKGNLIIAPNGSGKTNILEGVYYSVYGDTFRPIESNAGIIKFENEFARYSSKWDLDTLDVTIALTTKLQRKFTLNGKVYQLNKITSKFPVILFAPHTVDLVLEEPSLRRQDLNSFLTILNPEYRSLIRKYETILRNRNAVIKQIREGRMPKDMLQFWTNEIIKTASAIYSFRAAFFTEVKDFFETTQSDIYINPTNLKFGLEYKPNIEALPEEFEQKLLNKYLENIDKEIIVGKTLYGVHKDDYIITLGNQNVKYFGSRGQQRIGILTLKLAQFFLYKEKFGRYPLLMLDDLMSELDDTNRKNIAEFLVTKDFQFIITSADEKEVPELLKTSSNIIGILE